MRQVPLVQVPAVKELGAASRGRAWASRGTGCSAAAATKATSPSPGGWRSKRAQGPDQVTVRTGSHAVFFAPCWLLSLVVVVILLFPRFDSHSWQPLSRPHASGHVVSVSTRRYLVIVLDLSAQSNETDMRPTRLRLITSAAAQLIRDFFDYNPLSQICVVTMHDGKAHR